MQVFISNFSRYKGDRGVSISNSKPKWANVVKENKLLAPEWEMVEKWNEVKELHHSRERKLIMEEFKERYFKKLESLGIEKILNSIEDNDVLLCWCKKDGFCHRYLLADFLNKHGVEVKEI